jgi:dTDP-alpha-D-glucose dehydrogenase
LPPVLHLTPIEVDTDEKRSKISVAVVGCGHKGIFYANAFADAGYKVICTDADASVVKKIAKGKTGFVNPEAEAKLKSHIASEKIDVTSERKKAVSQSDIIVIAITAKADEQKKNDYTGVISTAKQVGAAMHQGTLVIYGGIAGLGFTEGTMKELLENTSGFKAGVDFGLAYSPILNATVSLGDLELKVAATDQISLEAAATILRTLTSNVREVSDLKTAETATLFTVAKQDASTALTNELAVFCETAKIDYFKVLDTLNLNNPSFRPTIAEEENKNEAYLLLEAAENLNVKLKVAALARQINEDMVKHAVNLTQEGLRNCGKSLRRVKVAVLGPVTPASDASVFVKLLEQKGAKVALYDPTSKKETLDSDAVRSNLNEAVEGADCIVVLSTKEQFNHLNLKKLKALTKNPAVIVDLVGKFEPVQVETEGFIYSGLGRGTDQK